MGRAHGTISAYKSGGCRCDLCRQASRDYDRERRRRQALGRPTTDLVDAEPARAHVRTLMRLGWSCRDIASASGAGHIDALVYGQPARGVAPLRRISGLHERRILALPVRVRPSRTRVDAAGPRRRVQALCAIGRSIPWQAAQLGIANQVLYRLANGVSASVLARHAVAIGGFYEQWWNRPPPPGRATSVVLHTARTKGYLPPAAWDDDLIDLPESDLEAELSRRVALMEPAELYRAYQATRQGERSPVIAAAGAVYLRRRLEVRRATKATTATA